ncbi:MAG: DUF2911 domain-containing protein [Cytophagales bacterium]|nr:DUF2911 domain-containing protein [Cytophagales bacterium]
MKNTISKAWIGAILISMFAIGTQAQTLKTPAPSPLQTVKQSFALGDITLEYSRPSVKGRVIFGDLVPFGKVWRTGANASTKITFSDDVKLEGVDVKAGTYAIYSIPNKDSWDIMLYKDLTLGGNVADYKPENEVLRVKSKPLAYLEKVEMFTINITDITPTSATLELLWDKTRVPLKISTEIDAKVMKTIETALANDTRPYFQAANYYYENNKDLNQALTWVNKAIESNPKAFFMVMLKARIELKLNDKASAIASAEKTIVLAKEAKNEDFVKMAETLIAEAKKK